MTNNNSSHFSFFWLGFLAGSAALYFVGTKKGRDKMYTLLSAAENIEDNILTVLEENQVIEKGKKNFSADTISQVLSKIQTILPSSKD